MPDAIGQVLCLLRPQGAFLCSSKAPENLRVTQLRETIFSRTFITRARVFRECFTLAVGVGSVPQASNYTHVHTVKVQRFFTPILGHIKAMKGHWSEYVGNASALQQDGLV